jgi:hypothetical protein
MSRESKHIVLAGDSIFDNDMYVMGEPGVIQQMRQSIPNSWSAFKVAVDGACISGVERQMLALPMHATDLIVSAGGNDALGYVFLLDVIRSPEQIAPLLEEPIARFAAQYGAMLDMLAQAPVRLAVCTIYAAVPFDDPKWRRFAPAAVSIFNNAIIEQAAQRSVPVIRLDEVCTEVDDFSKVSPIEPSAKGGQKIVDAIIAFLNRSGPGEPCG